MGGRVTAPVRNPHRFPAGQVSGTRFRERKTEMADRGEEAWVELATDSEDAAPADEAPLRSRRYIADGLRGRGAAGEADPRVVPETHESVGHLVATGP